MKKALIILALLLAAVSAFAASDKGIVTVYMPSPAGLANKLAADFEAKTGIEVKTFQGTTGEILARLETEKANPVADVVILASWSDGLSMKDSGQLVSYTPANEDKMVPGWIDEDSMLFGYSASAVGVIYNTLIYPTLDADWAELADPEFKNDIAIPDPELSGACKDFVAGYVNAYGWDTFEALADNGMIVPGANKAALEAVTTGEVGVLVAGVDYNAYSSIDDGEPLGNCERFYCCLSESATDDIECSGFRTHYRIHDPYQQSLWSWRQRKSWNTDEYASQASRNPFTDYSCSHTFCTAASLNNCHTGRIHRRRNTVFPYNACFYCIQLSYSPLHQYRKIQRTHEADNGNQYRDNDSQTASYGFFHIRVRKRHSLYCTRYPHNLYGFHTICCHTHDQQRQYFQNQAFTYLP